MASKNIGEIKARLASLLQKTTDNGASEAEAMAAMAAAEKIAKKYSVSLEDIKADASRIEIETRYMNQPSKHVHEVDLMLAVPISNYAGVRCWLDNDAKFPRVVFFGIDADVELAVFLRAMLREAMVYEWNIYSEYVMDKSAGRAKARASFMRGFSDRIRERLAEFTAANKAAGGTELIVVKNQLVTKAFNKLGLNLTRSYRSSRGPVDPSAYAAGGESGGRASLGRGVGGTGAALIGR